MVRATCALERSCYAASALDPERLEKLVAQVLEETRAFRQEFNEKIIDFRQEVDARFAQVDARFAQVDARFAEVDEKLGELRRDLGFVQAAVLETASGLREVAKDVKRVETKLDAQGARIDKLEGAAE